jgi:hypothetical protein
MLILGAEWAYFRSDGMNRWANYAQFQRHARGSLWLSLFICGPKKGEGNIWAEKDEIAGEKSLPNLGGSSAIGYFIQLPTYVQYDGHAQGAIGY